MIDKASALNGAIPVLLAVRELGSGGIERDVTKLAIGFPRAEFIPHVATYKPAGPRFEELHAANVPILHLNMQSINSRRAIGAAWALRRYIHEHRIQVVHALDSSAVFLVPIARFLKVPVVLSSVLGHRNLLDKKSQTQMGWTDRFVDAVVVNCEAMRAHVVDDWQVPRERVELCYNGVDTNQFYVNRADRRPEFPPASLVIGAVCVLRPEKNLALLQQAFAKVRALAPNSKLLLVGSGPELPKLQANAEKLRITADSIFVPTAREVASYMRSIDIFVSCSYSEAFSNSILEAMACGCCVVGSRVGGTPELITHGDRGLLFTSNDADDLAEKLAWLLHDAKLRKQLGDRAADFAANKLSMAANLERTGEIYHKYLHAKKRGLD